MANQTLEIRFKGVCTHFHHNYISGFPHRVVLPDASFVVPGLLTGPFVSEPKNPDLWIPYVLLPHVPLISIENLPPGEQQPFTTPGLFAKDGSGYLITPAGFRILNAVDPIISYPSDDPDQSFLANVAQLTTFYSDYVPSNDVITAGRAAAYFDLFGGIITAYPDGEDIRVKAVIVTDGPPEILVTPFGTTLHPDQPVPPVLFTLTVPSPILSFGNHGVLCGNGSSNYDYLLHYLTGQTGIPRALTAALPGMDQPDLCPPPKAAEAFIEMIRQGFPSKIVTSDTALSAACSDSRYP